MLTTRQFWILGLFAAALWGAATAWMRFFPAAITDPLMGDLGYVVSVPVGWLCVRGARRLAGLAREQLVAGTAVVVGFATLIDGAALRWMHPVYGRDGTGDLFRLGSAWLLWGYGASLMVALAMTYLPRRRTSDGQRTLHV